MTQDKLSYSINQAVAASGLSRAGIYRAMKTGRLRAVKHGHRTFLLRTEIERFLNSCEDYQPLHKREM